MKRILLPLLLAGQLATAATLQPGEALPPATLQEKKAVYIADISGMPGLISTMMAVPKMQKAPYSVALIRFAKDGEQLPRKPGAVTVLKVESGTIRCVDFAQNAQQISSHLK